MTHVELPRGKTQYGQKWKMFKMTWKWSCLISPFLVTPPPPKKKLNMYTHTYRLMLTTMRRRCVASAVYTGSAVCTQCTLSAQFKLLPAANHIQAAVRKQKDWLLHPCCLAIRNALEQDKKRRYIYFQYIISMWRDQPRLNHELKITPWSSRWFKPGTRESWWSPIMPLCQIVGTKKWVCACGHAWRTWPHHSNSLQDYILKNAPVIPSKNL